MGAGRPVVFLPGAGWPGRQGLIIGELMAKTHLFAMLDLPGYGRSQGTVASASDRAVADWRWCHIWMLKGGPLRTLLDTRWGAMWP